MAAFFQHFSENLKVFEEKDAMAMNQLFGLTNFDKFKESILQFKRDDASTFQSNEEDAKGVQDMSNLDEDFYWKLKAEDVRDPKTGWSKKMDSKKVSADGPTVSFFQKTMSETKLNMTYCEVFYPKLKMAAFKDFFQNIEKNEEMMQGVQKFDVVSRGEDGFPEIMYSLQKIPMMTMRENLMKITSKKINDG